MITIDSDPVLNPVNIGAHILSFMSKEEDKNITLEVLYHYISKELDVSYEVFTCALDWLYAIEAINMDDDGMISYASK